MNHSNKIWTFMLELHVPPYLLYIRRIFNYRGPAILACTSCERLMHFHCPLTWAWWNIDEKIIILDAETSNLPTRKLQPVNAYMYGPRNNFKKIFGCISIVIYNFWYMFLRLKTGEMPSCGISSWYALFVKVQKDLRTKNIIFSSRRKR